MPLTRAQLRDELGRLEGGLRRSQNHLDQLDAAARGQRLEFRAQMERLVRLRLALTPKPRRRRR